MTLAIGFAALVAAGAFLIGSIPFGYLIGRFFYKTDLRQSGSGNIGAMNALRTLGRSGAIAVLVLDAGKGFLPVALLMHAGQTPLAAIAAAGSVLGHCFSPWLGWKGGKGVATSFGAIFALSWQAGLVAVAGWLIGAILTQYSSVGSMLGNLLAAPALWLITGSAWATAYGVFAAIFIIYTHRENIGRLRAGNENRIRLFKQQS